MNPPRSACGLAVLAAAVAMAQPASAAPPWSAERAGTQLDFASSWVAGTTGRQLLAGPATQQRPARTRLVAVSPAGRQTRTRVVSDQVQPVAYDTSGAVFLRTRVDPRPESGSPVQLDVSFGRLDATRLGTFQTITRDAGYLGDDGDGASVAAASSGDVLTAWTVGGDELAQTRPAIGWRRAGGTRRLTRGGFIGPEGQYLVLATAVSRDGKGVVVLRRGRDLVARVVDVRKGSIGREQRLGRAAGTPIRASAAVSPAGRAVVSWQEQDGGEEAGNPAIMRAAVLRAGRTRFDATQTLDPGGAVQRANGPRAAIDDAGRATVAWDQVLPDGSDVRTAARVATTTGRGTRFGTPQELLARGSVVDLVGTAEGVVVSLYEQDPAAVPVLTPKRPLVAVRSGDGPFVQEQVADTGLAADLVAGDRVYARWSTAAPVGSPVRTATRPLP